MPERKDAGAKTRARASGRSKAEGGAKADSAAAGAGSAKGGGKTTRGARQPDLKKDLRGFASARPEGWDHEDWIAFLESLQGRGHDIRDRDAIGLALERERLDLAVGKVKGVGPRRREALVDHYGNLWNLRNADPDEIATIAGVKREVAEKIRGEAG